MAKDTKAERRKTRVAEPLPPVTSGLDPWLLGAALLLIGFGLVMVYSATVALGDVRHANPEHFLAKQGLYVLGGLGLMGIAAVIPYTWLRRLAMPLLILSLLLLFSLIILPHVAPGIAVTINHSTRWLKIGSFQFQPSELAKLAFVIYLAHSIAKKVGEMRRFSIGVLPHVLVLLLMMGLALAQPDLGTCIILALILTALLFVAGTRLSYLLALLFAGVPLLLYGIMGTTARWRRLVGFLDPWGHRYDEGFQPLNALMALASGGVTGLGLGRGPQKLGGFLPQSESDFILPVIGEELGFVGVAAVLLLLCTVLLRGTRIARRAPDDFSRYLAYGLTLLLGLHAAINAGVAVGLLPTKGLTLPLVSLGGSSMFVCAASVGILLNLSRYGEAAGRGGVALPAAGAPTVTSAAATAPPAPTAAAGSAPADAAAETAELRARRTLLALTTGDGAAPGSGSRPAPSLPATKPLRGARPTAQGTWFGRLPGLKSLLGRRPPG